MNSKQAQTSIFFYSLYILVLIRSDCHLCECNLRLFQLRFGNSVSMFSVILHAVCLRLLDRIKNN